MLYVGQILYGFCGGYFDDDDSNDNKRIEFIGVDYVVAREVNSERVVIARFPSNQIMMESLKPYTVPEE